MDPKIGTFFIEEIAPNTLVRDAYCLNYRRFGMVRLYNPPPSNTNWEIVNNSVSISGDLFGAVP